MQGNHWDDLLGGLPDTNGWVGAAGPGLAGTPGPGLEKACAAGPVGGALGPRGRHQSNPQQPQLTVEVEAVGVQLLA